MYEFLAFFAGLVVMKAVIEPLAANVGRALIDEYLDDCCFILDNALEDFGLDFNPEDTVRKYLDLQQQHFSKEEMDEIVEAVFEAWDLRVASRNHLSD